MPEDQDANSDTVGETEDRCSTDSARLSWAIQNELHGTLWDPDHQDMTPENLPPWWIVQLEHHQVQLARFREDVERLLQELDCDEPNATSVLDMYGDAHRGLGRIHGSLGRLPGMCHIPTETFVLFTKAMFLSQQYLLDRYAFREERQKMREREQKEESP